MCGQVPAHCQARSLFGTDVKRALLADHTQQQMQVSNLEDLLARMRYVTGPYATQGLLLRALSSSQGRLDWAVNIYFREGVMRLGSGPPDWQWHAGHPLPGRASATCSAARTSQALRQAAATDSVWRCHTARRWGLPDHRTPPAPANPIKAQPAAVPKGVAYAGILDCSKGRIVPIVYGFPSGPLLKAGREKKAINGGDYLLASEPVWACNCCRARFAAYPYQSRLD
ncbi:hypothetical protein WJX84_007453 [Apatococcus fuscideae]|uniref:Uncharacterized protein n=1 Tax=Apatococcus fuscideae TaxID=2026836 RepID=A0AAW1TCV5_9CHLO